MELNKIYNEDLFVTMNRMVDEGVKADVILTSPPYNNSRPSNSERALKEHESRYDIHLDNMDNEQYTKWTCHIFNMYDQILSENGVILYNMSYGSENVDIMYLTIASIIQNTNFCCADCITWKKKSALPNNTSSNKLTRITENIFVFVRRNEFKTFNSNKSVTSENSRGQKYYENIFNYIEARNNDGSCKLNKATYSSELCEKLLGIYAQPNSVVYDSFMGTGTTAVACKRLGHTYLGSELSNGQCEFANERLNKVGD